MNEDAGSPLESDIAALLRDDGDQAVPEEAFRRVRTRLASVVPALLEGVAHAGPEGHAGGDGHRGDQARAQGPNRTARLARAFGAHPVTTALAFLGVGAAMGAAAHATLVRPPPEIRTVYVDRPAPTTSDPRTVPSSGEPSGLLTVPLESLPVAPGPAPNPVAPTSVPLAASPAPSASESSGETLAAERALLDDARTALARRDATGAASLLDQYVQTFPHGHLVEEREALDVERLAVAGQVDSAKASLARFRSRYSRSLFLSALESLVGSARSTPKLESGESPPSVEKAP